MFKRKKLGLLPRVLLFIVSGLSLSVGFASASEYSSDDGLFDPRLFLQEYCLTCHGDKNQKGDRRFDHLTLDFSDEDVAFEWQEILDLINLGEMPPEDEDQPSADEVAEVVSWITPKLDQFYALQVEKETTGLRRMNTFQYRNSLRDLLGLNMDSFNPSASFPSEERLDGFANIASKLVTSRYLLEQYLEAASASITKVVDIPAVAPKIDEHYGPDDLWEDRLQFRSKVNYFVNVEGKYVDIGNRDPNSGRIYPRPFEGVPVDGYYTITVKAEGVGKKNRYDPSYFDMDLEEPAKIEIFANDASVELARSGNPSNREIATIALLDNSPQEYKVKAWLDKGYNFGFRYANGPLEPRVSILKIQENYHPETITSNYRDVFADEPSEDLDYYLSDVYEGPRLRIHWTRIEGPLVESWPPENYRRLLGSETAGEIGEDPYGLIEAFASRAFRRPALKSEIGLYFSFYDREVQNGSSAFKAIVDTYKAILCSVHFLYIETPLEASVTEGEELNAKELQAYALASRLSYFLWGTMPDKELLEAAQSGAIFNSIEIRYQALRLLRDPRAEAFVSDFTDGWLGLYKLGQVMPDANRYKVYQGDNLEQSMRTEARTFFSYILQENRSIEEFLSADYSFVDRSLAKHYGIDHRVLDDAFRKVDFPAGSYRGGLLGQAGIHTISANGVDTSPVVRGIWILENILGTPPSPPPPDVPALEPDIRGATSIRDQLSKHREIATCNECHRKMDPLGFAMESFDAIGGFRDYYTSGEGKQLNSVDTSGKLPSGEAFEDVRGLKRILIERKEQFARCLTEKMMMYALGRELSFSDRPQIDAIVEELTRRGGGLQDLVEILVSSDAFLVL